jgi:inosine-uridine nucleoside N-ribohydrolase
MKILLDLETADPDDMTTLMLAVANPSIELLGVTISPGTPLQIATVKLILQLLLGSEHSVVVGAFNVDHVTPNGGDCVSGWHFKLLRSFGLTEESSAVPDAEGWQVLQRLWREDTILVTGAPLKNLGAFLRHCDSAEAPVITGKWVAQGGFAGSNVVPPALRLAKFGDAVFMQTFNFGGDLGSAELALSSPLLRGRSRFVSKNLCHRVVFTAQRLEQLSARLLQPMASDVQRRALELVHTGMRIYLAHRSDGKAFHDPLALAAALAPDLFVWAPVCVVRGPATKKGYGSGFGCENRTEEDAPHHISIDCDEDGVFRLLFCES